MAWVLVKCPQVRQDVPKDTLDWVQRGTSYHHPVMDNECTVHLGRKWVFPAQTLATAWTNGGRRLVGLSSLFCTMRKGLTCEVSVPGRVIQGYWVPVSPVNPESLLPRTVVYGLLFQPQNSLDTYMWCQDGIRKAFKLKEIKWQVFFL